MAPAHPGAPVKSAVKRLCGVVSGVICCKKYTDRDGQDQGYWPITTLLTYANERM